MLNKKKITPLLLIILSLSALASNTIAPLTTIIAKELNVNINLVVLLITIYFFGNSIGQILSGNLSDIKGRKKVLIVGIIIFILSSVSISVLHNIYIIIILSFIQGIGGGVLVTIYKSTIFDIHKGEKAQKIFSYLSSLYALINIAAPFIGIFINDAFGWRYIYILLSLVSLITLISIIFLFPKIKNSGDNSVSFFIKAKKMIQNLNFLFYSLIVLISYSLILFMITILPILFKNLDFMNNDFLPYSYAGMILFYMIGNLFSVKYVAKPNKAINISLYLLIILLITLSTSICLKNEVALYLSLAISNIFSGILLPLYSGLAIQIYPKEKGLASSINGAIQIGGGALLISIMAIIINFNLYTYLGFVFCLIPIIIYIKKRIITKVTVAQVSKKVKNLPF
jgi:DHA1 family bicyclomycin/chloramphenicol resistance-like MFS transporter